MRLQSYFAVPSLHAQQFGQHTGRRTVQQTVQTVLNWGEQPPSLGLAIALRVAILPVLAIAGTAIVGSILANKKDPDYCPDAVIATPSSSQPQQRFICPIPDEKRE